MTKRVLIAIAALQWAIACGASEASPETAPADDSGAVDAAPSIDAARDASPETAPAVACLASCVCLSEGRIGIVGSTEGCAPNLARECLARCEARDAAPE